MKKTRSDHASLVYYAPGGGLGHLTRAIAILRQWKKLTRKTSVVVGYTPYLGLARREDISTRSIPGPDPASLRSVVNRAKPDVLLVDTFPRGLVGEVAEILPALNCPAVLVQRFVNPMYLRQFGIAAFVGENYRLAIRMADALPPQTLSRRTVDIPPVTVREASELPPGPGTGWLFVDWGEGSAPFIEAANDAAQRVQKPLRVLRPGDEFPALLAMAKSELVIGAGGYNLYHEAALLGVPTIFVPNRRMYDDQFGRTAAATQARTPDGLRMLLQQAVPPAPLPLHRGEGATVVVRAVQALLQGRDPAEVLAPATTAVPPPATAAVIPAPPPVYAVSAPASALPPQPAAPQKRAKAKRPAAKPAAKSRRAAAKPKPVAKSPAAKVRKPAAKKPSAKAKKPAAKAKKPAAKPKKPAAKPKKPTPKVKKPTAKPKKPVAKTGSKAKKPAAKAKKPARKKL